jgi:hypothetical protein
MIRRGRIECDGCGDVHRCDYDGPGRPGREYMDGLAQEAGWLVRGVEHYCRTCRLAVERDSLVPAVRRREG